MDPRLLELARATRGFMPETEGLALHDFALGARPGLWIEIGSYCGKSTVYLAASARERGAMVVTIDHHRGSEEHQAGEEYHDPQLFNEARGRIDTLPCLLSTLGKGGLDREVLPVVGHSSELARTWNRPVGLVFVDGGHSEAAATADYEGWAPHVESGGLLLIHDVFEDPAEGGRPPYLIYRRALDSGDFVAVGAQGSLRALRRN